MGLHSEALLYGSHAAKYERVRSATASESAILTAAEWLVGKTLREIGHPSSATLESPASNRTKHIPGHIYERYFNIPQNSDPRPDFVGANIELKSTGLIVRGDGSVGQKERISLRMMGAFNPDEAWDASGLRTKLDRLLLVFYGYERGRALGDFKTLRVVRWSPMVDEIDLMHQDFELIRERQASGLPLSESFTRVLGSATKGPGRSERRTRAYALKERFVHSIYLNSLGKLPDASMLAPFGGAEVFESTVLHLLHQYVGRRIDVVGRELGVPQSQSKNAEATVIRRLLGLPSRGRTREFEQFGLEVKTAPISPAGTPLEYMSFASFRPIDLAAESWASSELRTVLNRLLVVPLVRESRSHPRSEALIGRAFFWSPSARLLALIGDAWESYRHNVELGRPDDYPRKRDGLPILVNSHGQTSAD